MTLALRRLAGRRPAAPAGRYSSNSQSPYATTLRAAFIAKTIKFPR
jgi:hypothetical protein